MPKTTSLQLLSKPSDTWYGLPELVEELKMRPADQKPRWCAQTKTSQPSKEDWSRDFSLVIKLSLPKVLVRTQHRQHQEGLILSLLNWDTGNFRTAVRKSISNHIQARGNKPNHADLSPQKAFVRGTDLGTQTCTSAFKFIGSHGAPTKYQPRAYPNYPHSSYRLVPKHRKSRLSTPAATCGQHRVRVRLDWCQCCQCLLLHLSLHGFRMPASNINDESDTWLWYKVLISSSDNFNNTSFSSHLSSCEWSTWG